MLVIRRRAGESFLIEGDIEVEVLEIGSSQVKLGILAPRNVSILRKEVHITRQQNRAASREISPQELAKVAGKLRPSRKTAQEKSNLADKL
jgi:carbon storage regulator